MNPPVVPHKEENSVLIDIGRLEHLGWIQMTFDTVLRLIQMGSLDSLDCTDHYNYDYQTEIL